MTAYTIISAMVFVLYLQTGAYILWKNPQVPLNRWFCGIALFLAGFSLFTTLFLSENLVVFQYDLVRMAGWGMLSVMLFRFYSLLTGHTRNRILHDGLYFFFIIFGAGSSLFLFVVLHSFDHTRLYLLEDWFWLNQFSYIVYYVLLIILVGSTIVMFVHWRKGFVWQKEKRRLFAGAIIFAVAGTGLIVFGSVFPDIKVVHLLRLPHLFLLPWFISVGYGFAHYRFLPPDPAKASRKLLLELKQLLFFCDKNSRLLEINPFAVKLTGSRSAEILGDRVQLLFINYQVVDQLISDAIISGDSGPVEVLLRNRNGSDIPVLLSATLLKDSFGDDYGVALYGTDQREAIALRNEINKRQVLEVALQAMSGDLESQVDSHTRELRYSLEETSLKINRRKKVEGAIKVEIADMEVMMGEIHTRIKKNIGIILSLLKYNSSEHVLPENQIRKKILFQRINTVLMVNQQVLTHDSYGLVDFKSFLEILIKGYKESWKQAEKMTFSLQATPGLIWVDQAIPLAIVANELINNSIRHAFVDEPASTAMTEVVFSMDESKICSFQVWNNGRGFDRRKPKTATDYSGLQLVKMLVEDQLSGSFVIEDKAGVLASVSFPLDQKRQGHIGLNS